MGITAAIFGSISIFLMVFGILRFLVCLVEVNVVEDNYIFVFSFLLTAFGAVGLFLSLAL